MNGVCGTASGTASSVDRGSNLTGINSPSSRRGGPTGIGSLSGVGSISGCSGMPTPGPDSSVVRKSRSQGGKKLQKCLSTASYGEDSSFRLQMVAPPISHNLLMTRQYCSFGSTTHIIQLLFRNFQLITFSLKKIHQHFVTI